MEVMSKTTSRKNAMLDTEEAVLPEGNAGKVQKDGVILDDLARLPEKALLDEAQLAKALDVTPRTIRRMVSRFELPPPVSLGGRPVWFAGRVLAHIEAAAERAEREADRRAKKTSQLST